MLLDAVSLIPGIDPLAHLPLDYEPDVDLFAGGGGASTGYEAAFGKSPDIAINHDMEALTMHRANHPDTIHICQNVINVEPLYATGGRLVRALWASPDCTHFSKAKGGKPRNQFIRDLAWTVVRWAQHTKPKIIGIENVEEFKTWGPLDAEGQPIKARAGETFREWTRALRKLGYTVSFRELRACDYGAPTTRKRLFVVARLDGKRVRWPKPTHGPGTDKPWRTAAECIDWNDPAPSIFERKKPLADNTQRRIAEGIRRYVLKSEKPFLVTYYGMKSANDFRGQSLDEPLRTQTTENRFGLVTPFFATPAHSTSTGRGPGVFDPETPLRTITSTNTHAVVAPYLVKPNHTAEYYQCFRGQGADEPLGTVTQAPGFAVCAPYLVNPNHSGDNFRGQEVTEPVGTMTGKGSFCLTAPYLVQPNHSTAQHFHGQDADSPLKTITGKDTHAVVTPHLINIDHKGSKGTFYAACREVTEPLNTVTTENRHALIGATLIQTGYGEREGQAPRVPGLDKPLGTVVAGGVKHALTTANLIVKNYSGVVGHEVDRPLGTVTSIDHHSLVSACLVGSGGPKYSGKPTAVDKPIGTIVGENHKSLATAHMVKMRGTNIGGPVDAPLHTISAQGQHHGLVSASIIKYYTEGGQHAELTDPMPTSTAKARFGLQAVHLQQYNGASEAQPVDDPLPTVSTKDRFGLTAATPCQYNGASECQPLDEPAPTLLGQNKMGLVQCALEAGGNYLKVREFLRFHKVIGPDEEAVVVIDGIPYLIEDIGLRMMRPRELFTANGFPLSYKIDPIYKGKPLGITSQVKKCGNSVPPQFVTAVFTANKSALNWKRALRHMQSMPLFDLAGAA